VGVDGNLEATVVKQPLTAGGGERGGGGGNGDADGGSRGNAVQCLNSPAVFVFGVRRNLRERAPPPCGSHQPIARQGGGRE
jgi:hypothetical protein